jgi:hypothetical protein
VVVVVLESVLVTVDCAVLDVLVLLAVVRLVLWLGVVVVVVVVRIAGVVVIDVVVTAVFVVVVVVVPVHAVSDSITSSIAMSPFQV